MCYFRKEVDRFIGFQVGHFGSAEINFKQQKKIHYQKIITVFKCS